MVRGNEEYVGFFSHKFEGLRLSQSHRQCQTSAKLNRERGKIGKRVRGSSKLRQFPYSCLKASIGSSLEAIKAGYSPNTTPIKADTPGDTATIQDFTIVVIPNFA